MDAGLSMSMVNVTVDLMGLAGMTYWQNVTMTIAGAPMNMQGRVVIPAALRKEMGLEGSVDIIFRYEYGILTVETIEDAVDYVQRVVAHFVAFDGSLVEDFLAQQRSEAAAQWKRFLMQAPYSP